jgi:hypothetical protein
VKSYAVDDAVSCSPTLPVTVAVIDPWRPVKSIVPVTAAQTGPQVPVGGPYVPACSVPL